MLFSVMLACACALSAWQARNHDSHRAALAEVSRADPLTGCLNRRGFEERALAALDASARRSREGAVLLLDVDHLKLVNDRYGHAAGDELLSWVADTLRTIVRPSDAVGRLGGDEFAVLVSEISAGDALRSAERMKHALADRAPCSVGVAMFPLDGSTLAGLLRRADERLYTSRHGRPADSGTGSSERLSWAATLAHTVDLRTSGGYEHSHAVAELAVAVAARLGWKPDMQGVLRMAAILHDVGKSAVPDEILCKPGPLTLAEAQAMQRHSAIGAELVARIEGLAMVAPWIRSLHERYDGSGYPDGLAGEDIPRASRILLVADAYDALTSSQPWREALTEEQARIEIAQNAGTQFDPECVQALLAYLDARETGRPLRGGFAAPA